MNRRRQSLALIEFESAAFGMLAVDRMIKRSPIAVLRCGTVHPGRYLVLVGGSVASTEEAYEAALAVGEVRDSVLLPDPHPALDDAVDDRPAAPVPGEPEAEAMAVVETLSSPALLRSIDAALKAAPVRLNELRLSDDLGGRGLAVMTGGLTDLQAALDAADDQVGGGLMAARTLMPRAESLLQEIVGGGTSFRNCGRREPAGAETVEG